MTTVVVQLFSLKYSFINVNFQKVTFLNISLPSIFLILKISVCFFLNETIGY